MKDSNLTQANLRERLFYDPEMGIFTYLVAVARCVHVGDVAGTLNGAGYSIITINCEQYYAHRLAWLYMTGAWPEDVIDHVDLNRSNNRWTNLREADGSSNHANSGRPSNNTSGFKGVRWHKKRKKWIARIKVRGRDIHLGSFHNPQEAHEAYCRAALEHFREFARVE